MSVSDCRVVNINLMSQTLIPSTIITLEDSNPCAAPNKQTIKQINKQTNNPTPPNSPAYSRRNHKDGGYMWLLRFECRSNMHG